MIINLRGTSGSGKSYIIKKIMGLFDVVDPIHIEGRQQPYHYHLWSKKRGRPVFVIGHYETPCGGADTIKTFEEVLEMIDYADYFGFDVLFEGLLFSPDTWRLELRYKRGIDVKIVALTTSLEDCIASVEKRRRARGNNKPLKPKNTVIKDKAIKTSIRRITEETEMELHQLNRRKAYDFIRETLGV